MGIIAGGKARIGIVTSAIHYERVKGFIDALIKNHPNIHIVDSVEVEEDNDKSFYGTKTMMKKNPAIQALFVETVAVYGICRALTELGMDRKVKVICFDDMPVIRNLIMEGRISASVFQNPFWQGYRSFEMLWDYLLNRKLPEKELNYSVTEIRIRESFETTGK
jgi:LacI family transcriptional regulator